MVNHGLIFTGIGDEDMILRPAGAFRIRTWLSKKKYNIEVIDFFNKFSEKEIEQLCEKYIQPTTLFVGVSITFFNQFSNINFLFKTVKEKYPHVKTIIGGNETTLSYDEHNYLDTSLVDRIIWGYAEEAITHYCDYLTKKRLDNLQWVPYKGTFAIDAEKIYKNDDTDLTIEWYDSDIMDANVLPIEISRGCIFKCKYCSFPLLGKKKNDYIRYEQNLTDEFRRNYEKYGVNVYSFQDDTFNDNIVKLETVANAIAKSNVKIQYSAFLRADLLARYPEMIDILVETGIISSSFGIESLKDKTRKAIGKAGSLEKQLDAIKTLKEKTDVWTHTGMIIGLPYETTEDIYETHKWFIEQSDIYFNRWQFFPLALRLNPMTRASEFERNYADYGYTLAPNGEYLYGYWENDITNFNDAWELSSKLNHEVAELRKESHWVEWRNAGKYEFMELIAGGMSIKDVINRNYDNDIIKSFFIKRNGMIEKYKQDRLNRNL
jgi:hypothetical protein